MTAGRGGLGRGLAALIPVAAEPPEDAVEVAGAVAPDARGIPSVLDRSARAEDRLKVLRPGETSGGGLVSAPVDLRVDRVHPTPTGLRRPANPVDDELVMLPVTAIVPNPRQPRLQFDEHAHEELVASVREVGVLQPIVVRPARGENRFEIVMGERRWRAAADAGLAGVPAIVRETPESVLLRDALIENVQRSDLNPLEEANGYAELIADQRLTHDQIAEKLGRSRSHVTNTLRLLTLPTAVQRRIAAGVLSAGHAKALLAVTDPDEAEALATRIVAENLSVRAVEEIVAVARPPRARRARPAAPTSRRTEFEPLADRLSEHFETRVKVELGKARGRIVVEFGSVDDLRRIVQTMVPEASEVLAAADAAASGSVASRPDQAEAT